MVGPWFPPSPRHNRAWRHQVSCRLCLISCSKAPLNDRFALVRILANSNRVSFDFEKRPWRRQLFSIHRNDPSHFEESLRRWRSFVQDLHSRTLWIVFSAWILTSRTHWLLATILPVQRFSRMLGRLIIVALTMRKGFLDDCTWSIIKVKLPHS